MLKYITAALILYTCVSAGVFATEEDNDFIDKSIVEKILPHQQYETLLSFDENAMDSENKFNQLIEKFKGTVVGEVLGQTKEEILSHVRKPSTEQACYMVRLSDQYRCRGLPDDKNQSAESKWLLTAAQQGYILAISQIAELFRIGTFYFKENQDIANKLDAIAAGHGNPS